MKRIERFEGLMILVLAGACAGERVPATTGDVWAYQQELDGCALESPTPAAVNACWRAAWARCEAEWQPCPSRPPAPLHTKP